jgi:hypothetical protein
MPVPSFEVYWSAFEQTRLYGVIIPYRMRLLMKLAFLSGIVAAITFSRLVRAEFPREQWAAMIDAFEADVQQQMANTERVEQRRRHFPNPPRRLSSYDHGKSEALPPVDSNKQKFSIGKDGKIVDL